MVYRRYTIRSLDRVSDSLDLEIFAHAKDGPAIRWASAAKPGDLVEAIGPRGKITLVPAGWYLFAGDEAFIPASFAMLEALPARTPAWAFLEVAGPEEEQPLSVSADLRLTWLHRGAAPPGDPAALAAAIKAASLPSEPGHAYVGAELQITAALRSALEARGFAGEHISSKAYWGRGRANASHGEPNRD
jgi:NADPH-dependent ferric siderophore reductase